jgi:GT2 family glycosyltransferase
VRREVSTIVVTYHGAEALERCLTELGRTDRMTVVDNSSSTEVRNVTSRHGAEYVDAGANHGFAAGVNLALRPLLGSTPRDVLLLNPDARLSPGTLDRLVQFLHEPAQGRVGCVAPRLVDSSGREQRVTWPFPSPFRMWMEAVGAGRVRARADFVTGSVLLLRWEALQQVGELDERFFLYGEETDWERRAAQLGWRAALCPDVVAVHDGAGSSADPRRRELLFHAGQETYIRKWYGRRGWWVYRIAACAGATARAVMLSGDRRAEAARRARLYARGPRRSAGLARG